MNAYTEMLKIYLDACCLLRFSDDQTQKRIRNEKYAIALILSRVSPSLWSWVASEILIDEVDQGSYPAQRAHKKKIRTDASQTVLVGAMEIARAKELEALGLKRKDALHLACAESGAADIFLSRVSPSPWSWVASDVLIDEVDEGSYPAQRDRIKKILTYASQTVLVGAMEIARAEELEALGLKGKDALHLACAESGAADIFLTTDDRLLRTARADPQIHLQVENPHTWWMGVTKNEPRKNANAVDA